jgi:hypothetical protein
MSARLDHLEHEDRRTMQMKRSRASYFKALATAQRLGFSGSQARLAAMVIAAEQALNHRTPDAAEIRNQIGAGR